MTDLHFPETFVAQRDEDVSGVSGEGVIAEGCRFSDGWVVTHWLDQPPMHEPKTDVWHHKGVAPFRKIHGHGGRTRILWAGEVATAQREIRADIAELFDVPAEVLGTETECAYLQRQIERAIQAVQTGQAAPVEVGDARIVDAVMPVVEQLLKQRDRWRAVVSQAFALAYRWQDAHGTSMFLVRTAGAELQETLNESGAPTCDVFQPVMKDPASNPDVVGEARPACVCGSPVVWAEHSFDPGWIHEPGSDTKCAHARPRCPECQLPHALIPGRPPWCRAIRTHLAGADHMAAAECSARHTRFTPMRQCIRAAQHCGDHIDEHGFHWSETVAVYPVVDGQPVCGRAFASTCTNPDHACTTCGDCVRQHPGEGGCFDPDQQPADQGPLTGIEVRTACPYCTGAPMFGSSALVAHIRDKHARVQAVLARGGSLDEQLAAPETRCRLPHDMEA
ncbi:hypothetical protein KMT30_05940 [Streptomyces sp. IBSBF 2953]|nr:hypothetical protein [Streptomyces hayashii]